MISEDVTEDTNNPDSDFEAAVLELNRGQRNNILKFCAVVVLAITAFTFVMYASAIVPSAALKTVFPSGGE